MILYISVHCMHTVIPQFHGSHFKHFQKKNVNSFTQILSLNTIFEAFVLDSSIYLKLCFIHYFSWKTLHKELLHILLHYIYATAIVPIYFADLDFMYKTSSVEINKIRNFLSSTLHCHGPNFISLNCSLSASPQLYFKPNANFSMLYLLLFTWHHQCPCAIP